jgi:hypothetical protein
MDHGFYSQIFGELPSIYNQLTWDIVEEHGIRINFQRSLGAVSIFKGLSVGQQGCKQGPYTLIDLHTATVVVLFQMSGFLLKKNTKIILNDCAKLLKIDSF